MWLEIGLFLIKYLLLLEAHEYIVPHVVNYQLVLKNKKLDEPLCGFEHLVNISVTGRSINGMLDSFYLFAFFNLFFPEITYNLLKKQTNIVLTLRGSPNLHQQYLYHLSNLAFNS